ncbi:MAG: hypothetical protein M1540_05610 [Candidatus Bathyarchaeota archaeon]|nr:hypothetical protein [Candidatus Bathyarchaeota archaeon]
MEAYFGFVKKVVAAFNEADFDFAFTGALAISYYGVPRTTSDVDVIVAVASAKDPEEKLASVLRKAGLVVDEREMAAAFRSGFRIASFRAKESPYSLDVILSGEKLEKQKGQVAGLEIYLQSPEGLIAAKLRMIKATVPPERSAKDKKDIKAILQFTKVDLAKVKMQAKKDKTEGIFDALGLNA